MGIRLLVEPGRALVDNAGFSVFGVLQLQIKNSGWNLLLKIEKFDPGMSMKDRMAREMIFDALKSGRLAPDGVIIESSSGNTATGLAYIAAELGMRIIMPHWIKSPQSKHMVEKST